MRGIAELMEKKGFFDVLFALSKGERSFNELDNSLDLSPNTLLARLREAQRAELVREQLFRDDNGRSRIKYILTANGKRVIRASGPIKKNYLKLRKKVRELEKQKIEKETEIRELLSSIQRSAAIVSISGSKIEKRGKGNLTIKAEVKNDSKIKKSEKR